MEGEAATVRRIYREFLSGRSPRAIANGLTADGVPTATGKGTWTDLRVRRILKNVKYKGDAILQLSYCEDYLTKKRKANNGELPQYYVKGSHPAIIPEDMFERVQVEFLRRESVGRSSTKEPFFGRVVCGDCGIPYGPKVWHSNEHYRTLIWRCNHKYKFKSPCTTPSAKEGAIIDTFLEVLNGLWDRRDELRAYHDQNLERETDASAEERRIAELDGMLGEIRDGMDERTSKRKIDNYNRLVTERRMLTKRVSDLRAKRDATLRFLRLLEGMEGHLTEFDPQVWLTAVKRMVIRSDGTAGFEFSDGTEVVVPFDPGVRKIRSARQSGSGGDGENGGQGD